MSADYWLDGVQNCEPSHPEHHYKVETLRADPARFKTMDPPNGWGDYDWALRFVESFARGCALHPEARIDAWL